MISIIIPSFNETYLERTIKDILQKAKGDFEIIIHIDSGEMPDIKDERILYCVEDKPIGMRGGINYGLDHANGDYIMKTDAHCAFDEGFDVKMMKDMQDDWLMIPRRYSLHADNWDKVDTLPIKDYHHLSWPGVRSAYGRSMYVVDWPKRTAERFNKPEYMIDDTMVFQGSCWLANKKYFMEHVGYLDDNPDTYSSFSGEQVETGLKYWLGGGKIKVNKNTWYAHLFKNKKYYGGIETKNRDYKRDLKNKAGYAWYTKHWMRNEEPNMKHKFEWLVEKFMPVPGWPLDKKLWTI